MLTQKIPAARGVTVLLVDDQPIIGEAVRRMLAGEEGLAFHYCKDAPRALEVAAEVGPTVILQDLVMPEIEGLELVKRFRADERFRDVPIIVLSTKEEAAVKAEAFAVGANDYIVKLPDRLELIARVRYHSRGFIALGERNEAFAALQASQQVLANDLATAAHYVRSLLPPPQQLGSVAADWRFIPSAELGGDAFGYHHLDDTHLAVYRPDERPFGFEERGRTPSGGQEHGRGMPAASPAERPVGCVVHAVPDRKKHVVLPLHRKRLVERREH